MELLPGDQERVVYRLIGMEVDIKDVNDFNLRTKELGYSYWNTYTKSGIGGVQVTSLDCDPRSRQQEFRSEKLVII